MRHPAAGAEHRRRRGLRRLPAPRRLRARHPGERRRRHAGPAAPRGGRAARPPGRARGRGLRRRLARGPHRAPPARRRRRAVRPPRAQAAQDHGLRPVLRRLRRAPAQSGVGGHRLPGPGDAAADARAGAEGHPDRARVRRRGGPDRRRLRRRLRRGRLRHRRAPRAGGQVGPRARGGRVPQRVGLPPARGGGRGDVPRRRAHVVARRRDGPARRLHARRRDRHQLDGLPPGPRRRARPLGGRGSRRLDTDEFDASSRG